jgi:hypothetical protein
MVDDAFDLSRISARPVLPGEAEYDAIREALMETSRGRWFLREYARRAATPTQPWCSMQWRESNRRWRRSGRTIGARKISARPWRLEGAAVDGAALAAARAGLQLKENLALIRHHQGNLPALAKDRRRGPHLRPDRFADRSDRGKVQMNRQVSR